MRHVMALAFASSALILGAIAPVQAVPTLGPASVTASDSPVTPVGFGCARGYRWNPVLKRCTRF